MKDRVDADGNKTLLIEEAQSDWHQTGADRGYVNNAEYADLVSEEQRLNKVVDDTNINGLESWGAENAPELAEAITKARVELNAGRNLAFDDPLLDHTEMMEPLHENLRKAKIDLDDAFQADYLKRNGISAGDAYMQAQSDLQILRAELDPMHDAVPDAPFKTDDKSSWYNLAMKRGLIEAAEGDYDKLAITTGKQQADRYDLSKSIGSLKYQEDMVDGRPVKILTAYDNQGMRVLNKRINDPEKEIPSLIGKDAAKALLNAEPYTPPQETRSIKSLRGQDLSIGGEGMKQFYDRTLPNTLNKLVKQDGVKVGQSGLLKGDNLDIHQVIDDTDERIDWLDVKSQVENYGNQNPAVLEKYDAFVSKYKPKTINTDTVHSIDVTPEMRERVKKGLPLFAQGGAVVGAGALFSPGEAHANLMDEDKKLRAMGSKAWGKVSPELAAYRRAQILPDMATLAQGAVRDTAKGLDYLSPANLTRLLLDPANEGLSRFISPPISNMRSEAAKVVTQPMLYDEDDQYSKERKRKTMDIGGMLFSPI
jgi:hypothetical protein